MCVKNLLKVAFEKTTPYTGRKALWMWLWEHSGSRLMNCKIQKLNQQSMFKLCPYRDIFHVGDEILKAYTIGEQNINCATFFCCRWNEATMCVLPVTYPDKALWSFNCNLQSMKSILSEKALFLMFPNTMLMKYLYKQPPLFCSLLFMTYSLGNWNNNAVNNAKGWMSSVILKTWRTGDWEVWFSLKKKNPGLCNGCR